MMSASFTTLLLAFFQLASASLIPRQYYGGGGFGGGGYPGSGSGGGAGNPFGSNSNPGDFFNNNYNSQGEPEGAYPSGGSSASDTSRFLSIDYSKAATARIAHASLAASAFVFFLPMGAILVRILPGRLAVAVHFLFQIFGYILFVTAAGLGIWIALDVKFSNFDLLKMYHPIIGLVIFGFISLQPIGGILHHIGYKRTGGRTFFSHVHIWMGRILITLGMINGGLGLRIAGNASRGEQIAYGVIAGIIWLIYMLIACVFGHVRRPQTTKAAAVNENGTGNGINTTGNVPWRRRRTLVRRSAAATGAGAAADVYTGEKGPVYGNENMVRNENMASNGEQPTSDEYLSGVHNIPPIPAFTQRSEGDRAHTPMSLVTETTEGMRSPVSPVHNENLTKRIEEED